MEVLVELIADLDVLSMFNCSLNLNGVLIFIANTADYPLISVFRRALFEILSQNIRVLAFKNAARRLQTDD